MVATSVSGRALRLVNAPWKSATKASTGLAPESRTNSAATAKPQTSEMAGSSTASRTRRLVSAPTSGRPRHQQPDALAIHRVAFEDRHDAPAVHHGHPVGQ